MRRHVVVQLILEAKARQHPSYLHIDQEDVIRKATMLPEDGILTLHHLQSPPQINDFAGCQFERLALLVVLAHHSVDYFLLLGQLPRQQLPFL